MPSSFHIRLHQHESTARVLHHDNHDSDCQCIKHTYMDPGVQQQTRLSWECAGAAIVSCGGGKGKGLGGHDTDEALSPVGTSAINVMNMQS